MIDTGTKGSCGPMGNVGVVSVSRGNAEEFKEFVIKLTDSYLRHVGTKDRDSYLLQDINTMAENIKRAVVLYLGKEGFENSIGDMGPRNSIVKRDYLLYVRKWDGELRILRCKTDSLYRVIGKIYSTTLEKIERIDYNDYSPERERFWKEEGCTIFEYQEPILGRE